MKDKILKTVDRHDLYINAFFNTLEAYGREPDQNIKPLIKKLIVYGVKAINTKKKPEYITEEGETADFQFAEIIKDCIGALTPREFMNLFPIDKDYDGHKYGAKDYFYTMDYIRGLGIDKPIGEEVTDFLWDYMNAEIHEFLAISFSFVSNLRHLTGQKGIAEEWLEMNGITTYTMHKDSQGKEYMIDNQTGKTIRIKKPRPRYLKAKK
ncbi:hypothetical protein OXPF_34430 [Oxobacter pfennigii]|uniref:Uncharacterized protein n=1 Tax=Oxobacter pfennigii TaxID=36849 RepID=A0A0P8W556_9CLOT|nr:hypothetical protein [Oxobacter pfennigii]KPU43011.1 hypothetical protein OXPF_34430 [Oxobacter pfennigii]